MVIQHTGGYIPFWLFKYGTISNARIVLNVRLLMRYLMDIVETSRLHVGPQSLRSQALFPRSGGRGACGAILGAES